MNNLNTPEAEPEFYAIRICCECKVRLPKIACHPSAHLQVTHGYCTPCKDRVLAEFKAEQAKRRAAA